MDRGRGTIETRNDRFLFAFEYKYSTGTGRRVFQSSKSLLVHSGTRDCAIKVYFVIFLLATVPGTYVLGHTYRTRTSSLVSDICNKQRLTGQGHSFHLLSSLCLAVPPPKRMPRPVGTCLLAVVAVLMLCNLHRNATTCPPSTFTITSSEPTSKIMTNTNNPMTGFFRGWNNGTTLDRETLDDATKKMLPERLIAVFGLESSGAKFVQQVLAQAIGATLKYDEGGEDDVDENNNNNRITPDFKTQVQHFSLPFGHFENDDPDYDRQFESLSIVPVFVPKPCRLPNQDRYKGTLPPAPPECHPLYGPTLVPDPARYFINVMTHVQFYQQRGVDTTAVVVVRDPAMHFRGVTSRHCKGNETAAYEQYKTGRVILQHAMEHLDPKSLVVVSYETLMTLKQVYLKEIYKSLNIIESSSTHNILFKNGNIQYIPASVIPPVIAEKLESDTGVPSHVVIPKNLYEPKSLAQVRKEQQLAKKST